MANQIIVTKLYKSCGVFHAHAKCKASFAYADGSPYSRCSCPCHTPAKVARQRKVTPQVSNAVTLATLGTAPLGVHTDAMPDVAPSVRYDKRAVAKVIDLLNTWIESTEESLDAANERNAQSRIDTLESRIDLLETARDALESIDG